MCYDYTRSMLVEEAKNLGYELSIQGVGLVIWFKERS